MHTRQGTSPNHNYFAWISGSVSPQALGKRVSDDPRRFFFRCKKNETWKGRLPPRGWLCSAWNFGKTRFRWSPTFHFSTPQTFFATKIFVAKNFSSTVQNFFQQTKQILEELWRFSHQCRMQLENSLPELSVSAFYDPWRRGKKGKNCFCREFWPKKNL